MPSKPSIESLSLRILSLEKRMDSLSEDSKKLNFLFMSFLDLFKRHNEDTIGGIIKKLSSEERGFMERVIDFAVKLKGFDGLFKK